MLVYESRMETELDRLKEKALAVRSLFDAGLSSQELLTATLDLADLADVVQEALPKELLPQSSLSKHLAWMERRLGEDSPELCRADIDDICERDIASLKSRFAKWCASNIEHDSELSSAVEVLLRHHEYDSAIRKAFVLLKSRLTKQFGVSTKLDGTDLVNAVFGSKGVLATRVEQGERAPAPALSTTYRAYRGGAEGPASKAKLFQMSGMRPIGASPPRTIDYPSGLAEYAALSLVVPPQPARDLRFL
jgi:hypothetical protein